MLPNLLPAFVSFKNLVLLITGLGFVVGISACAGPTEDNGKINIVATTSIIANTAEEIGGDAVEVTALMGPGIDPHTYKSSEGDIKRLGSADLILYNGLHLEAKMTTVFEKMEDAGRDVVSVSKDIARDDLIAIPGFEGQYDPHIWMDPALWSTVASTIAEEIIKQDPTKEEDIRINLKKFQDKLASLKAEVDVTLGKIAKQSRVLITAHDAFNYFGRAFNFEVMGLQGVSTASEAGAMDVQGLSKVVVERKIPAIFIESSVSPRNVQALQEAVSAKGFQVAIGRALLSDSVGDYGTPQSTYIGMIKYNAETIGADLSPKETQR